MNATFEKDWPDPVEVFNAAGTSRIVLVCEHASNHIPVEYGGLGLDRSTLDEHIAWDPGAAALTRALARELDAAAFLGCYSRLLIDLNRPPDAATSAPTWSETTRIEANEGLTACERARRIERIFNPFQQRLGAHIDRKVRGVHGPILVSIHSFTPVFNGWARPWHAGVLFRAADPLGRRLVQRLSAEHELVIGTNQPYAVSREEDYALLVHGDDRGVPAVLLEVRNDGLRDAAGVDAWTRRLAVALQPEEAS